MVWNNDRVVDLEVATKKCFNKANFFERLAESDKWHEILGPGPKHLNKITRVNGSILNVQEVFYIFSCFRGFNLSRMPAGHLSKMALQKHKRISSSSVLHNVFFVSELRGNVAHALKEQCEMKTLSDTHLRE